MTVNGVSAIIKTNFESMSELMATKEWLTHSEGTDTGEHGEGWADGEAQRGRLRQRLTQTETIELNDQ